MECVGAKWYHKSISIASVSLQFTELGPVRERKMINVSFIVAILLSTATISGSTRPMNE